MPSTAGALSSPSRGAFGQGNPSGAPGPGFGPIPAVIGAIAVLAILGALVWSAVAGSATPARHPTFFGGTAVLADNRPLISLDLATGTVEVQLSQISSTVGATSYSQVQPVALDSGTLLVNRSSGNFNWLAQDNFVVDRHGGGIGLGPLAGSTGASGVADGASAFIVRFAPLSAVSLVGADTVNEAAMGTAPSVPPDGFAMLNGSVPDHAGAMAAAGGSLYVVVDVNGTDQLERLDPAPSAKLSIHQLGALGPAGDAGGRRVGADVDAIEHGRSPPTSPWPPPDPCACSHRTTRR